MSDENPKPPPEPAKPLDPDTVSQGGVRPEVWLGIEDRDRDEYGLDAERDDGED